MKMKLSPKVMMRMLRVALTPREWLLRSKLSNGAIVYGKNRPGFGGRGVYLHRDSIEPELLYLNQFLDSTGVFVDVGANTGIYTLKAAKHFDSKGMVLAIEPFPDVLATLHYSVQRNGFTNVRLRNICLGDCTETRTLWMNFGTPNSFSLMKREASALPFSVLMVSMDHLFEWEGLDRLDYLKIDAEGAEAEILKGASQVIEKYRPIIQVEIIIKNVTIQLKDYSIFHAPKSSNRILIPNEHPKINIPKQLGWKEISGLN